MADDYYELLGVSSSATDDELKRAYRRLARELHPDTNQDPAAEERFKLITVAYETLRDPERRRRYDMFGPDGARSGAGTGFPGDVFGAGLGDLFQTFFGSGPFSGGGGRERTGPPRGADLEAQIELDFQAAVFGTRHDLRLRVPVPCSTCGATGASPGTEAQTCSVCGGSGEVRQVRQSLLGQMVTATPCHRCGGTGKEIRTPCRDCRGEGRRTEERTYTVDVPAGVDNGNTLRLSGRGAAGPRGGPTGDLYVHIRVQKHERFRREGYDLIETLHVPMVKAALGAHLTYETLDGTEDLVIPAGTQTGRVFRLRGRGVPHVDGRGRGDLRVELVVDTPSNLTKEEDELLRLLAAEQGEEVAPVDNGLMRRIRGAFK